MQKLPIYFILIITTIKISAQDFGIEMWRDHLPYSNTIGVVKDGNKCYAATPFSLYYYDEEDNSLQRINKINGLNDLLINTIGYNKNTKTIIVGYENGNLDLIKNNEIYNINAILQSNIIGSKSINNIHNEGDLCYLACGFGIVVVDIKRKEIKDTYIFGPNGNTINVNDITTNSNQILATTNTGIYSAIKNMPFLSDFNQWTKINSITNPNARYTTIHYQNNQVFVVMKINGYATDTLFVYDTNFEKISAFYDDDFYGIESKNNNTLICKNIGVTEYDASLTTITSLYTYAGNVAISPNHCIWDGKNHWIADKFYGLNKSENNWSTQHLGITGPHTNNCFQLASSKNTLWVATGTVDGSQWNNGYNSNGIMSFDQKNWKQYDRNTYPVLSGDSIFDFIHIAINPKNENHIIASTFTKGLLEFKDGNFINNYNHYNTSLQVSLVHGNNQVKTGCAIFDNEENIWAVNSFTNNPLTVITKNGYTQSFSCGSAANNVVLNQIIQSKNTNHLWIAVRGKGIIVYDYNNTPLDPTDDQFKLLTTTEGSGNLPSINVNSIVEDKDGEIWIGTDKGPAVFYNPSTIFNVGVNNDAQKVLLEQDGIYNYLLDEQNISSIVIDGADRKWFGTKSGGIFLMSADGTQQIHYFNTSNSPIFSNNILSLALNDQTGELYIGTDRGIIGFKGTATESKNSFDDIYAFPNPVRPEYEGGIAIRGLMNKSDVKITDSRGQLVYSTISNGGQAIWNGQTLQGERVSTGVYYVFVISSDGSSKSSTKILFVK